MRGMKKMIIAALVLGGLYYGYTHFMAPKAGGKPGGGAPVGVAEVTEREVQQWQEFSGRLVA